MRVVQVQLQLAIMLFVRGSLINEFVAKYFC